MGTQGVGHADIRNGSWRHRDWGIGTQVIRHRETGSGAWENKELYPHFPLPVSQCPNHRGMGTGVGHEDTGSGAW